MKNSAHSARITVEHLRCEGLASPTQIETLSPRFSWQLSVSENVKAVSQTAFEIEVWEVDSFGNKLEFMFCSDRIESRQSQWLEIPELILTARSLYQWRVRVWDHQCSASEWSQEGSFGTGLCGKKWFTPWIGDGRNLGTSETAPARYFKKHFKLDTQPVRARLFISALGLVEPWLNGKRVSEDLFIPGWPDYRNRVFYCAFDVSRFLKSGCNTVGMILADGFYSGTMIPGHQYGPEARFSGFLELMDSLGNTKLIPTDESWEWTDQGPIVMNSIYDGETYDARKEIAGWCDPIDPMKHQYGWTSVKLSQGSHGDMMQMASTGRLCEPVRRQETIQPVFSKKTSRGTFLYDFGQNFAGWARLKASANAGDVITMKFAEFLEHDDQIHTGNLRTAKATATYIASGNGIEVWEPRFTYFGFRYVELSGVEEPFEDALTGIAVYADLKETGYFECSNQLLNKLWKNTLWGQKSNFLEIPTDCPQRDERVGWTGDAQVFAPTALHNMACGNFLRQWLYSVRDGLRDDPLNGGGPDIAPRTGFFHGSAGWAEAQIIVPWAIWQHTGDRKVIEENFPTICHVMELMANESKDGIRKSPKSYGDWLSPGYERDHYPPRYELIATAYFAHAADLTARMAIVLGKSKLATYYEDVFRESSRAFRKAYFKSNGRCVDDFQTSYLLAIRFDLLTESLKAKAAKHLVRTFEEKNKHLATGFLGTPLINHVLSSIGKTDLAYEVLQQKTYPGWLFSIVNGATTVWERWDSWTPENGFHKDGMNSFNHYAYGSVVKWFYDTIVGIQALPEYPGWKHFRIEPHPGGGLDFAKASLITPYGEVKSSWKIVGHTLQVSVTIPANTSADVVLPIRDFEVVEIDDVPLARTGYGSSVGSTQNERVAFKLGSGSYEIVVKECSVQ